MTCRQAVSLLSGLSTLAAGLAVDECSWEPACCSCSRCALAGQAKHLLCAFRAAGIQSQQARVQYKSTCILQAWAQRGIKQLALQRRMITTDQQLRRSSRKHVYKVTLLHLRHPTPVPMYRTTLHNKCKYHQAISARASRHQSTPASHAHRPAIFADHTFPPFLHVCPLKQYAIHTQQAAGSRPQKLQQKTQILTTAGIH